MIDFNKKFHDDRVDTLLANLEACGPDPATRRRVVAQHMLERYLQGAEDASSVAGSAVDSLRRQAMDANR